MRGEGADPIEARFRVERPLGRGGMGTVVLAWDSLLERRVAIKRAHRLGAADVLRFKREFRAIERLSHPNLVRLHELGVDARGVYFTMEAIDGADLVQHCAPDPLRGLEQTLPGLLSALAFLHANGVVHCDLKPTNVLVARDGTVKLLDFGVLAEIARTTDEGPAGTPAYVAPERICGEPPTPATDAYALGCTLYEVLSGAPPFGGPIAAILAAHQERDPAPLAQRVPHVPEPWAEVTHALLAKDPAARPTLAAVSRALLRRSLGPPPRAHVRDLVGRASLQEELASALDGGARVLALEGPSGVGKSTLLEWLAERAERSGRVVLRTASRAAERLPFNGLDAAMDELARLLARDRDICDRRTMRLAGEAFPVLRGSSQEVGAVRERVREALFGFREHPESRSRREVFDALVELLDRVAADAGLVLAVDDFQWADADSVALLRHVAHHASDALRIAVVLRDDVEPGVAHAWLRQERDVARCAVEPLATEDLITLLRERAADFGAELPDAALREVARTCAGRPFLAEVAARGLAHGRPTPVDELVRAAATGEDRDVLALLVAHDGWAAASVLADLTGASRGAIEDALVRLSERGLVRTAGAATERAADLYHDGVRSAAQAAIPAEDRASAHSRIADRMASEAHPSLPRLVRHLVAAGRVAEAASHARAAAHSAEQQRAFSLAADMYEIALSSLDEEALRERRAWALERSSRYAEAAAEWARLATRASDARRLDLSLHEAHALIAANRIADGLRRLDAALVASGRGELFSPAGRAGLAAAVATAARFAIGPVPWRGPRKVDPSLRARAERNLKIGILLAFFDPLAGMRYLQGARADFVAAGADAQVAGCDYTFAFLALVGSRSRRVRLAERYVSAALARSRSTAPTPELRGMPLFVDALKAMRAARWDEAHALFERAAETFAESVGTTELTMARSFRMMTSAHQQDLPALRAHIEWFRRHAEEAGGTFLLVHLGLCEGYLSLLEGAFDAGFDSLTRAAELFDEDPPNAQRAAMLIYRWAASVYSGDPVAGWRRHREDSRRARRFRFLDTMYAQPYGGIAALLEANALRAGDRRASARVVERIARRMDGSPPLSAGAQWRARAYAEDARGRPELALGHLWRAEDESLRFQRPIDAAIARWQRGRRLGGDEGRALCESAVRDVRAQGGSELVLEEDAGLRA